jgi:hypothetical protein
VQLYRARNPKQSPLWQCVHRHFAEFVEAYPRDYQPRLGALRPVIPQVIHKFLDFHPHVHALVADGLFTRDGTFHPAPGLPLKPLEELFRANIINSSSN